MADDAPQQEDEQDGLDVLIPLGELLARIDAADKARTADRAERKRRIFDEE